MAVGFNHNINFSGYNITDTQMKELKDRAKNNPDILMILDNVKSDEQDKIKKHGFKEKFANFIKFSVTTGEITKGTIKGTLYGAFSGLGILAFGWLKSYKNNRENGNSLKEVFKKPLKSISKNNKIIAGISSAAVLVYHILKANMHAQMWSAYVDKKINKN